MIHRRGFFSSLAGIVVGGAGAAVANAHTKPFIKPTPAKVPNKDQHIYFLQTKWNVPDPRNVAYIYGFEVPK